MPWNRKLWGISFVGSLKEKPRLLGAAWDEGARASPAHYFGEPTRALLFTTRAQARAWCDVQHARYLTYYDKDHICRQWRFRPVRVRERVTAV